MRSKGCLSWKWHGCQVGGHDKVLAQCGNLTLLCLFLFKVDVMFFRLNHVRFHVRDNFLLFRILTTYNGVTGLLVTQIMIMYTINHIKRPCIIRLEVPTQLKRALTFPHLHLFYRLPLLVCSMLWSVTLGTSHFCYILSKCWIMWFKTLFVKCNFEEFVTMSISLHVVKYCRKFLDGCCSNTLNYHLNFFI